MSAKNFIKMIADVHAEKFDAHLAELANKKTPCGIFFGFTVVPRDVIDKIQSLSKRGINFSCVIVLADVQADALKKFVDVPVITLEDFPRFGEKNFPTKPQEIFVVGGIGSLSFAPYFARNKMEVLRESDDGIFFFMMKHLPELYGVYEMLGSDESKKVFRAAIKGRLTGKIFDYRFASEPQYFLEGFTPAAGDIAIDGGAFDGATALSFAKRGAKVFAFELDAINFKNCAARLNDSKFDITLENLGLSDKESVENYAHGGVGSRKLPQGNLRTSVHKRLSKV